MKRTSKTTGGSRRPSPARPAARGRRAPSAVAELLHAFDGVATRLGLSWYVFGAQALAAYGVPRATADVDVTVMLGGRQVVELIAALERGGFVPKITDATFVAETRVLPLRHLASGWDLDVVLGGPGVEELFMSRVRTRTVEGVTVPFIAPDDLVATKLLAQRAKDLEDVRVLLRTAATLDHARLTATVTLLEEALDVSDLAPLLARLRAEVQRGPPRPITPGRPARRRR